MWDKEKAKVIRVELFSSLGAIARVPLFICVGGKYQEKRACGRLRISFGMKSRELGSKLELMRGLG